MAAAPLPGDVGSEDARSGLAAPLPGPSSAGMKNPPRQCREGSHSPRIMSQAGQQRPLHLDAPSVLIDQPPAPPPPLRLSSPRVGKQPDIRCPYDVTHDEGFLLRCLIRHYGWSWVSPGVLRRPDTTIAAMREEVA